MIRKSLAVLRKNISYFFLFLIQCDLQLLDYINRPGDHEVQIEQHAVLGEAEPVFAEPVTLFSTEDSEELNNYCSVRRKKLSQANPVTWHILSSLSS
jgi:hypothetical protein